MRPDVLSPEATAELLRSRRTIHLFRRVSPPDHLIETALDCARWAPNHRLTEPWRFYRIGQQTWSAVVDLNTRIVAEKRGEQAATIKRARWEAIPGAVLVTALRSADPVRNQEDYAATACAVHNMSLHLWSHGIGTKWSTGSVTRHPEFWNLFGIRPEEEQVVGLIFYGYPKAIPETQRSPLEKVVRNLP